jgi:hypothetical protein
MAGVCRLVLCVVVALAGAVACDVKVRDDGVSLGIASGRASDVWVRTYSLPAEGRLEVVSSNGPIEVTASAGPDIEVRVEREARARSDEAARELLRTATMVEEVTGTTVRVEAREGGESPESSGAERRRGRPQVSLRYAVHLPPGLTASFETGNGQVILDEVSGRLTVATTNGGIAGSLRSGGIHASGINGRVQLDLASVTAPSEITILNGNVRLRLPASAKAELVATAVNGRVTLDDAFALSGPSGAAGSPPGQGRVAGTINGGGPTVSVHATNGSVQISARGPGGSAAP